MSEGSIKSTVGDMVGVTVYFEYLPHEKQTYSEPGSKSEVRLTAVCVGNDETMDLLTALKVAELNDLMSECLESVEGDGEIPERE